MTSLIVCSVASHAPNAEGVVEYQVQVAAAPHVRLSVRRRFREFARLGADLRAPAGALPSKLFATSPAVRQAKLQGFLQALCDTYALPGSCKSAVPRELLAFLGLEAVEFGAARGAAVDYGTPQIPAQYAAELEAVICQVREAVDCEDGRDGWKQVGGKGAFSWFARAAAPGVKANRVAKGFMKRAPPRLVLDLFFDVDSAKALEPGIKECRELARLDEHTVVQYYLMHSIMFTPERDVILVRHFRVEPSGEVVVAEFSLGEFPGAPPADTGGKVRAVLTCGGGVVRPDAQDPAGCFLAVVNDMDPRLGDIPDWAQTKLNEITTTMLSANMFNLVKALAGKDLGQALLRGPQTNWNGSSGSGGGMGASPGPDASPSASAEGAEEDGWRAAKLGSALAAVALGLAVGLAGMLSSSHGTPA